MQHRDGQKENVKLVGITETGKFALLWRHRQLYRLAIEVKKENSTRVRISMGKISRGKVKLLKQ